MFSVWKWIGLGLVTIFWVGFLLGIIALSVVAIAAGYDESGQKH